MAGFLVSSARITGPLFVCVLWPPVTSEQKIKMQTTQTSRKKTKHWCSSNQTTYAFKEIRRFPQSKGLGLLGIILRMISWYCKKKTSLVCPSSLKKKNAAIGLLL